MRKCVGLLAATGVLLAGCGGGRTFAQADEEWCQGRWGQTSKSEEVCFDYVLKKGPGFLETIEEGEKIKAEVALLRVEHSP